MPLEEIRAALQSFVGLVRDNYGALSDGVKLQVAQFLNGVSEKISALTARQGAPAPIPDAARLLWELSGRNPEPFAQYLTQLPAPELQSIASNPGLLDQTVKTLQREMPQEKLGQMDGIPQAWLQSSNVYGYDYDPRSQKLQVRFQNGGVYEYDGVPKEIYDLFNQGAIPARTDGKNNFGFWFKGKKPSLGASLHWLVKQGGFPYTKLN